jgi:hypothetical protein
VLLPLRRELIVKVQNAGQYRFISLEDLYRPDRTAPIEHTVSVSYLNTQKCNRDRIGYETSRSMRSLVISHRQREIGCALDDTVDGNGGEPRTPESYLQAHNTEWYLKMRWILVDVSLLAKWELYKP